MNRLVEIIWRPLLAWATAWAWPYVLKAAMAKVNEWVKRKLQKPESSK